jgi:protein tyrosine phosphatase
LFGEAKYKSSENAYGAAFNQIVRFVNQKQDVSDIKEISEFCNEKALIKFTAGKKGFIAAFASKSTTTDRIIKGIEKNSNYKKMIGFDELICVAVNL